MDAAVLARLRANPAVGAVAGAFNGEPAIDHNERKSNDPSAFPAAIQTVIAGEKRYNQDGPQRTRSWRLRWECMSLDSDDGAVALGDAIVAALEPEGTFASVRFGRGFLVFERSYPPEDVDDLIIFRRIYDMEITATY